MKKWIALALCVLLAMMGMLAVASAEKVFHTYMKQDCPIINPHDSVETQLNTPMEYCSAFFYRPVANEDGRGYHYVGDVATELPVQVDELTWRIPLRTDAQWANGEPINAGTFMYSFRMLIDPILANKSADFLSDLNITIKNAKAYSLQGESGEIAWEDVGIKQIDDYTIEITTETPVTQNDVCTHFSSKNRAVAPVYEPLYEAGMNESRTQTTYGTTLDQWMSCGPYVFDAWSFDSVQVYRKNPEHWLADLFPVDTVEVRIIPEMNARVELWEQGALDYMLPDSNTIETYIDDPRTYEYPSTYVYHIDINSKNPQNPLCGSLNYRKALYHAINREVIARDLFGYQEPAGTYVNAMAGILSEGALTYRESEQGMAVTEMVNSWGPDGYSPELAREYMAKAFEECGLAQDDVVTLVIAFDESEKHWKAMAEYLLEEFPVIFEGRVKLELATYAGISTTDYKKTTDIWDLSPNDWQRSASTTYPYTCFYYYLSTYGSHPNNYFDEEFEAQYAVCDSAEVKADYSRMLEETKKLEEIYLEKVIHIPVAQVVSYEMFSDRVTLPVETYIPGFGWGTAYIDVEE